MKALILNSGCGSRLGDLTKQRPKCMVRIDDRDTILSRQLRQLADFGVEEVVITTGAHREMLVRYAKQLGLPLKLSFVHNPRYRETNYIYSLQLAGAVLRGEDVLLLHGDLVFENEVLEKFLESEESCMAVSTTQPLPKKDFKAVVRDGKIAAVGIEFFRQSVAAQPLYLLKSEAWNMWCEQIEEFCQNGKVSVYAENALNEITADINLRPLDMRNLLCREIDTPEDLSLVSGLLTGIEERVVYMCFSTDILHSGHMAIIKRARRYGKLIIGVLSDAAVTSYKRVPLLSQQERMAMFRGVAGVFQVVPQETLSYQDNILRYHPEFGIHGDDWRGGVQTPIRDEVGSLLANYGGRLLEYPYAADARYLAIDKQVRAGMMLSDLRRARLKKLLRMKGLVTAIEAHNGLTGLIAEKTTVSENGGVRQFDAIWSSSLCDSTSKGKPDIELVDMTSRLQILNDIMEVTTKPIIYDGDTGGLKEHFVYTVRTLERMGVSMIIIEDKKGLKKNSLFGTEVQQTQEDVETFCEKIRAGKRAQKTADFMICARIESLILARGMEDAVMRAKAFVRAGADAIMIHSRQKDPAEIMEFLERFRDKDKITPVVVVPTSFHQVTEEEFKQRGANIVIYANQLIRTGFPAMQHAAELILKYHRAKECDDVCMPFKQIIRLIPEDE